MERPVKGDVVVVQFPFSDIPESKRRPALVSATTTDDNLILCQITGQQRPDPDTIPITITDFHRGRLSRDSYLRPTRLFTIHSSKVFYTVRSIRQEKMQTIQKKFCEIFTR